jgi:hypothetical protein
MIECLALVGIKPAEAAAIANQILSDATRDRKPAG